MTAFLGTNDKSNIGNYFSNLQKLLTSVNRKSIEILIKEVKNIRKTKKNLFICGNGGSAANAIHLANDFLFTKLSKKKMLNVEALTSNNSVLTCLANDLGYPFVFSKQLEMKGNKNDMLLILSGSGNSKNLIEAIKIAKKLKMKVFGICFPNLRS